jgi:pimeloyl-ACP methyl ester carboxylesterase
MKIYNEISPSSNRVAYTLKEETGRQNQKASLQDGRCLGYSVIGKGKPVIYFHGTASSRLEVLLLNDSSLTSKLQIIGVDRPGYGLSTFLPRRNLWDFAQDVNQLADRLGFERFAVLSWSGGGPFLLAYLALFPERVTRAIMAGSPNLPFNVAEAHNNPLAQYAMRFAFLGKLALKRYEKFVLNANCDINKFLNSQTGKRYLLEWPPEDRKFFANPNWLALMMGSMAEAFRQKSNGVESIVQEHQLFLRNWDLPLSKILGKKLRIWQGTEDKTCRTENAYKIAKAIPSAKMEIFSGKGHCVMFDYLGKLGQTLL